MLASQVLVNPLDWLNDPALASGQWDQPELLDRVAEASHLLADEGRLQGNVEVVILQTGVGTYAEPARAVGITAIEFVDLNGVTVPVLPAEARTLDTVLDSWPTLTGNPRFWYEDRLTADTFGLVPAPNFDSHHYTATGTFGGLVDISDDLNPWTWTGTFGGAVALTDFSGVVEFMPLGTFGGIVDIIDGNFLWVLYPEDPKWVGAGSLIDVPLEGTEISRWPDAWNLVLGLFVGSAALVKEGPSQQLRKAQHLRNRFLATVGGA